MKAAQYSKHGGPEVIELRDIETPKPTSEQVLVENYAASINPFDFKVRNGLIPGLPAQFPITIGGDFSGKIIEVGESVDDYKVGDLVYGQASVFGGGSGSFAEYVVANPRSFYIKPNRLSFEEAASLPLVGSSAIQAIEDHIKLKSGEKILINGGSGGIGSIAIQIAKEIGAFVVASSSPNNFDYVKSLGADVVIDYKKENNEFNEFDAVFDTSGLKLGDNVLKKSKKGGIVVSMTTNDDTLLSEKYSIKVISQNSEVRTERLKRLAGYIEKASIKTEVEKVFTLDKAPDAYYYHENQKVKGKVVVKIK